MSTNFEKGLEVYGAPLLPGVGGNVTTGNVYFVDSGANDASDSNDGDVKDRPMATLDATIGKCTASNGDIILVMPGHSETLASAGAVTVDVAGITILGIGHGASRPTFNYTATAATFIISANDVIVKNLLFTCGVENVVTFIYNYGDDVAILDCETRDGTGEALTAITSTSAVSRLLIADYTHRGISSDSAASSAIKLAGGIHTDCEIRNFNIKGSFSMAAIRCDGSNAHANLHIHSGVFKLLDAASGKGFVSGSGAVNGTFGPDVDVRTVATSIHSTMIGLSGATQYAAASFMYLHPIRIVDVEGEIGTLIDSAGTFLASAS